MSGDSTEIRRLATISRGTSTELRISEDEFTSAGGERYEYISLRVWVVGKPTRKGVSIRHEEIDRVIAALQAVRGGDR